MSWKIKLKPGDTVTDEARTYVMDRDLNLYYISSGNHAKYHVSKPYLKQMVKEKTGVITYE